jgi:hypothetical protein
MPMPPKIPIERVVDFVTTPFVKAKVGNGKELQLCQLMILSLAALAGCNSKANVPVAAFDTNDLYRTWKWIGPLVQSQRNADYRGNPEASKANNESVQSELQKHKGTRVRWQLPIQEIQGKGLLNNGVVWIEYDSRRGVVFPIAGVLHDGKVPKQQEDGWIRVLPWTHGKVMGEPIVHPYFQLDEDIPKDVFLALSMGQSVLVEGDISDITLESSLGDGYGVRIDLTNSKLVPNK